MAGKTERQRLKRAAALALDDSRTALGRELTRVRSEWNPRELVRQSVEKHKMALVATAAVVGFVAVRLLMPHNAHAPRKRSWTGRIIGLASTALWSAFHGPITDFARSHFGSYFEKIHRPQNPPGPK
jgi:hypothetical protein